MVAVLGHDLRNPLKALTLAAGQAAGGGAMKEENGFATEAAQTGQALLLLGWR